MNTTPHDYVLNATKALRDMNGKHPDHAEIEHELAERCLKLAQSVRDRDDRIAALKQQLAGFYGGVTRP